MKVAPIPADVRADNIVHALARYFDWFRNTLATEAVIDGGRADVIFVSKARYVTEIEIKVSMSDWNADRHKDKWTKPRPHIKKFYYAVPYELAQRVPDWVPEHVGVLSYDHGRISCVRGARAMRAVPVTPEFVSYLFEAMYYRFWNARMNLSRERQMIETQRRLLRDEEVKHRRVPRQNLRAA